MGRKIDQQTEKFKFGPKPISSIYLNGKTEEEYRAIYEDNCTIGVVYILHKYTPRELLSYEQIGDRIGYKWRSVKNSVHSLRRNSILETSIKEIPSARSKNSKMWSLDNRAFSELSFDKLKCLVRNSYYTKNQGPNQCEFALLEICEELYPIEFYFSGRQLLKNKVGTIFPDIRHKKYKIVIEHFGSRFHEKKEEERRLDYLASLDYKALIIWDYKKKNRNKIKKQIKEFVDNAIQDIQQLVI